MTQDSTKPIAMTKTHAGVVPTRRFCFALP
jgi:hypothetical protein